MKLHKLSSMILAAAEVASTNSASAISMSYIISLSYNTSYDAESNDIGKITGYTTNLLGAYTTETSIPFQAGTSSAFEVYLTANDMSVGQDIWAISANTATTGGIDKVSGITYRASDYASTSRNPPAMGSGSTSNAGTDVPWATNTYDGTAFDWQVLAGGTSTGNGNGTYGDYAAFMSGTTTANMAGVGENGAYDIGVLTLTPTGPGSFGFSFLLNPGHFQMITNNTLGMGTSANLSYPIYNAYGDSVLFVPEPSTLVLLGIGAISLLGHLWHRHRAASKA